MCGERLYRMCGERIYILSRDTKRDAWHTRCGTLANCTWLGNFLETQPRDEGVRTLGVLRRGRHWVTVPEYRRTCSMRASELRKCCRREEKKRRPKRLRDSRDGTAGDYETCWRRDYRARNDGRRRLYLSEYPHCDGFKEFFYSLFFLFLEMRHDNLNLTKKR